MAHGGFPRRRVEGRQKPARRSKGSGVTKKKKGKQIKHSLKNQIRSAERFLRKDIPPEVRESQVKKLEELKKQQDTKTRLIIERKISLRDKKIKFFERRRAERMIRRLEKQLRILSDSSSEKTVSAQLAKYREDLEYIRFFPKTQKYVALYVGGDTPKFIDKRNEIRKQIKDNLVAAAASGKDLEETGSDDDMPDISDDDFFLAESSSEAEADDEWTDKSTREADSCVSGKATTSSMSGDERFQGHISDHIRMLPPRLLPSIRFCPEERVLPSKLSSAPHGQSRFNSRGSQFSNADHTSNLSSNSDVRKPRRKRRPKKKKQVSSA